MITIIAHAMHPRLAEIGAARRADIDWSSPLYGPLDSCRVNMADTLAESDDPAQWDAETLANAHLDTFEQCFRNEQGRELTKRELATARAALLRAAAGEIVTFNELPRRR